ncbi:MAG: flagellar biosynthetic protein FliR, partial [Pseudomonadota bacterium]
MALQQELQEFFLVFIRTSFCVMLLPGLSMSQIPMQVRLYAAAAFAIAVFLLLPTSINTTPVESLGDLLQLIFIEALIGASLALPIRFLFLALTFLGEIIVHYIGLNPIPGTPIGEDQAITTLSSLFNITAVVLLFSTGLMEGFVLAIAESYTLFPKGSGIPVADLLSHLAQSLGEYFRMIIRLGAPIIIYAVLLNMLAGLVNKLTPQIP